MQVSETEMQPSVSESSLKYVVILTYQRCGSTFFGNIFNLNPHAFYAYEPLDSLYSALYGTTPGWNVPSDITNNQNGSVRCEMLSCFDFAVITIPGNFNSIYIAVFKKDLH